MKKINDFIKFDTGRFFGGKKFVYKEGRYSKGENFDGCRITLICDRDDTKYEKEEDARCNELEELVIKAPGMTEAQLAQFKKRMPVVLEDVTAKAYATKVGEFASMAVSFTGNVKPQAGGNH